MVLDHQAGTGGDLLSISPGQPSVLLHDSPEVTSLKVTADSRRAVYSLWPNDELFSVPIDGSSGPANLSSGSVHHLFQPDGGYQLSLDSGRVVYLKAGGAPELYSAPVDGSLSPVRLNEPLPSGGDVDSFQVAAGGLVVYRATQQTNDVEELYSVPGDGSGLPKRLNGLLVAGGDVLDFAVEGPLVLYSADQEQDGLAELYRVPVDGGLPPVKLNPPLSAGEGVGDFASGGGRVVYVVGGTLHSVPLDGSQVATQLSSGGVDRVVRSFEISPDESRVVYLEDTLDGFVPVARRLFGAAIAGGGPPVELSGQMVANGKVKDFAISADSGCVVYRADQETHNVFELYGVAISGGNAVKLNGGLAPGGDVYEYSIDASTGHVLYRADQEADGVDELFVVGISGGVVTKVNGPLVSGGGVHAFVLSPTGDFVVYRAKQDLGGSTDLYGASISSLVAP